MIGKKTMDIGTQNDMVIYDFIQENRLISNLQVIQIRAYIEYAPNSIHDETTVYICVSNSDYGRINILDTSKISIDKVHTEFNSKPSVNSVC